MMKIREKINTVPMKYCDVRIEWRQGMKKLEFNLGWNCNGKAVRLPHDAQILETRSADASDGGHGYFPGACIPMKRYLRLPWNGRTRPYW